MVVLSSCKSSMGYYDEMTMIIGTICEKQIKKMWIITHVHSYSFHKSMHSNGSGQMTFEHGLFDGQFFSRFRAIVA